MHIKLKRANRFISNTVLLLFTTTISLELYSAELPGDYYHGLQLAFVRIPAKPAAAEAAVEPKPAQAPSPAAKPAPAPVVKPTPTPAAKPASSPLTKPSATPAAKQPPASPPKPAPVSKTSRPAESGRKQATEWVIGLGIDVGGDTLGTLNYADGSSKPVKANDGFMAYFGVILPNGGYTDFSTQLTVGYKNGGARGSGGSAIWTAIPLEVIEFYRVNDLRMGLGISYHLNPQLTLNAPSTSYVDKYGNAIGFVAQIGWVPIKARYGIDLRYTSIKYQGDNVVGPATANGSVVGLFTSYRF